MKASAISAVTVARCLLLSICCAALEGRSDWGEIQGITRAGIGEDRWYRFYDAQGGEAARADALTLTANPNLPFEPAAGAAA